MELKQYLKMTQQLVMTPQLQQAIKLLQLSRVELAETVQSELLENPVLEEHYDGGGDGGGGAGGFEDATSSAVPSNEGLREDVTSATDSGRDKRDDLDWESFVENYNQYSYAPGAAGPIRYGDDDMPTLEQTLSSKTNLFDHLEWQLGLVQLTDDEREVAHSLIGNINDDGYLHPEAVDAIAEDAGMEVDEVEAVLEVIQEFDPVGVGARNLKECLLIQAKHFYPHEDIVHAIIERHLENLEKRNVQAVLRDLGLEVEDLADAASIIANLEPKPGRGFGSDDTQYITPDVYVMRVGDDYIVTLNEDGLPKLKISNFYENRIKGGGASGDEKNFIQDKFRSAVWLIRSIHQRQNTIRKVTESIVRHQREFLDKGVGYLKPLILRDIAEDVGMHESTISRVTTSKYVHTPQGLFELKYFFNSRISSSTGDDLASESVKQRIKQMIGQEDPNKPLSDQKLCDMLAEEGTEIARRTVAKYREMLGIAPSSKRKKLF